jgi:putative redox protein
VVTEVLSSVDPRAARVVARTPDGHLITMDVDPPDGAGSAAGPKETLLASLAACTAIDVAAILRKKRQDATDYEVAARGISVADHPQVFTEITVEHRVRGAVTAEAIRRSVELSATKYCPVNAMLAAGDVRIEHRYRLEPTAGEPVEAVVVIVGPRGGVEVVG